MTLEAPLERAAEDERAFTPRAPAEPAVVVEHLARRFGGRVVLHDVSFSVAAGTAFGIAGANGSGKTALLRLIASLDRPSAGRIALILLGILAITGLSGITYGPVAALLSEMFPPAIRYSSLSIPYHLGTGYFGGFLPFISQLIVVRTGDAFAGLWYTIAVVAMAFVVSALWLPETFDNELD